MSTLRGTAYLFVTLFMFLLPIIMVFLISAALPKICRCSSVKLPRCPEAWSDEPCYLWFIGFILSLFFYGGLFFVFRDGQEESETLQPDDEKI